MARKVFLSFLGAGRYHKCVYTIENRQSNVVTYVQNSIIELLASDFDNFLIFCTDLSFATHFNNLVQESAKELECIKIPEGLRESEIWEIFSIVFDKLENGDEVIYDITHSFRSLPMLGITLLQYAKFLKNIKVRGIYYGAFENLGTSDKIYERYPNPEDRRVPLLNLTAFSLLQDWTIAANNFIKLGDPRMIRELTNHSLGTILLESKGANEDATILSRLSKQLQTFAEEHRSNRGNNIIAATSATTAKEIINGIQSYSLIPPFKPIVAHVKSTLDEYEENRVNNLLLGVQWCIDKELIQEGLTQLQEGIITILCNRLNFESKNKKDRELISSYLSVRFIKVKEEWVGELSKLENSNKIKLLDEVENIRELADCYTKITQKRNDINHGGFVEKAKYSAFVYALKTCFAEVKQWIKQLDANAHQYKQSP